MKKLCTKFTVKTSPMSFFNFGKYPKTATACDRFLEISHFKRDHEKVTFFLCAHSLFINRIMKSQKGLELVTSLSEMQNMFTKIYYLVGSFESGNWRENEKSRQNIEYLKNKKSFLEEIKTVFHNFWNTFFW